MTIMIKVQLKFLLRYIPIFSMMIMFTFNIITCRPGAKKSIAGAQIPDAYITWQDDQPPRIWPAYVRFPFAAKDKLYLYSNEPVKTYFSHTQANPGIKGERFEDSIEISDKPYYITAADLNSNVQNYEYNFETGEKSLYEIRFTHLSPARSAPLTLLFHRLTTDKKIVKVTIDGIKWSIDGESEVMELTPNGNILTIEMEAGAQKFRKVEIPLSDKPEFPLISAASGNMIVPPFWFEGSCYASSAKGEIPLLYPYFPSVPKVTVRCIRLHDSQEKIQTVSIADPSPVVNEAGDEKRSKLNINFTEKSEYAAAGDDKWKVFSGEISLPAGSEILFRYQKSGKTKYMSVVAGVNWVDASIASLGLERPSLQLIRFGAREFRFMPNAAKYMVRLGKTPVYDLMRDAVAATDNPVRRLLSIKASEVKLQGTVFEELHNLGEDLYNFSQLPSAGKIFAILLGINENDFIIPEDVLMEYAGRSPELGNSSMNFASLYPGTSALKKKLPFITDIDPEKIFSRNFFIDVPVLDKTDKMISIITASTISPETADPIGEVLDCSRPRSMKVSGRIRFSFDPKGPRAPSRVSSADFHGDAALWNAGNQNFDVSILNSAARKYDNRKPEVIEYKTGIPLAKITISAGGWVKIQSFGSIRAPEAGFYLHDLVVLAAQKWLYENGMAGKSVSIPIKDSKITISKRTVARGFTPVLRSVEITNSWLQSINRGKVVSIRSEGNSISFPDGSEVDRYGMFGRNIFQEGRVKLFALPSGSAMFKYATWNKEDDS